MNIKYSAIKNLFSAYLNQDFDLEFGSADEAILSFSKSAEIIDKDRTLAELDLLLGLEFDEAKLKDIIFNNLGCYYFYPAEWNSGFDWLKHIKFLLERAEAGD